MRVALINSSLQFSRRDRIIDPTAQYVLRHSGNGGTQDPKGELKKSRGNSKSRGGTQERRWNSKSHHPSPSPSASPSPSPPRHVQRKPHLWTRFPGAPPSQPLLFFFFFFPANLARALASPSAAHSPYSYADLVLLPLPPRAFAPRTARLTALSPCEKSTPTSMGSLLSYSPLCH